MQLKVGFAHESPNLNLFLLLTPVDLFFLKSGGKKGEREKAISTACHLGCVPPRHSFSVTFGVSGRLSGTSGQSGLQAGGTNQLFLAAGSR